MTKHVTIVVPVFNEEEILSEKIAGLIVDLEQRFDDFEIIISENGSTDRTKEVARSEDAKHPKVVAVIDDDAADYGEALIKGINAAKFDEVSILELDFLDIDFLVRSHAMLDEYDYLVGSKKISPGIDQRPFKRRFFTQGYNLLLKMMFRMPITETHGLKTLRKSKLVDLVNRCITKHAVYPTELTIRAWKDPGIRVKEVKLSMPLREIRTTRISATKRLKKTISDLRILRRALKSDEIRR
jgi:glycosyltransferase involved in cell wall biosynthesis